MLAVGRLKKIWHDIPDYIPDMETLTVEFEKYFNEKWQNVMTDPGQSLEWHRHWEAYLAIEGLEEPEGDLSITTLQSSPNQITFYNIIIG